jgi:hypothetical protein
MKTKIAPLPHWVLTDLQPAFYDTEAVTVLELLSKIYGKMNEVVDMTNEATIYMKDNLDKTVTELFEAGLESGTFYSEFDLDYDPETETITLTNVLRSAEE